MTVVSLACDTPTGPSLHPYQIFSNYHKQYGSYGLHKISASGELLHNEANESCSLHATRLLVLFFIPTKYYQSMSKGIEVMEHTRMRLRTDAMMIALTPKPVGRGIKSATFKTTDAQERKAATEEPLWNGQ